MKPTVTITLGAALFGILLAAYVFAYATTFHDPVEFQNGDLIVQNANGGEVMPVFAADGSGMSNIGVVAKGENGSVVIEVTDKVVETSVQDFLKRGEGGPYSVYRVTALSDAQRAAVVAAARRQLGKPSDFFMRRSLDQLYSTELVRLAYSDIGFDLGRLTRIGKVGADLTLAHSMFQRKWMGNEDCRRRSLDEGQCWDLVVKQEVVTPAGLVADVNVTKIFEVKSEDWLAATPEEMAAAAKTATAQGTNQ